MKMSKYRVGVVGEGTAIVLVGEKFQLRSLVPAVQAMLENRIKVFGSCVILVADYSARPDKSGWAVLDGDLDIQVPLEAVTEELAETATVCLGNWQYQPHHDEFDQELLEDVRSVAAALQANPAFSEVE